MLMYMKKRDYLLVFLAAFISCNNKTNSEQKTEPTKELSKLEQLLTLPVDSIINFYDLSNDSIREFPDLSEYTIKSLDLSHNEIDTLNADFLPKGIEKLDVSYNRLMDNLRFEVDTNYIPLDEYIKRSDSTTLREINLSHNKLKLIYIGFPLRKIIVSYNDVEHLDFYHKNIEYVDISYNPNLSNEVSFDPNTIDTVIYNNIANNKKLKLKDWFTPHIDYIIINDSVN